MTVSTAETVLICSCT